MACWLSSPERVLWDVRLENESKQRTLLALSRSRDTSRLQTSPKPEPTVCKRTLRCRVRILEQAVRDDLGELLEFYSRLLLLPISPLPLTPKYSKSEPCFGIGCPHCMKMAAIWNMAPCNLEEVDRRFRDTYSLHHQGDRRSVYFYETTWLHIYKPIKKQNT
jgi:hypothetical protein